MDFQDIEGCITLYTSEKYFMLCVPSQYVVLLFDIMAIK